MRTLKDVKIGETVTVQKLLGEGALKRRVMDMGITKGTEIFVRKVAPLGDPVEVRVRGYELSIRKQDAELIVIGPEDASDQIAIASCECGCQTTGGQLSVDQESSAQAITGREG